ncbi:DNA methyltransferase [Promethearchaeum syntrophicum]|uniref:site-specific DNA-methyltransferase (adenine-specific) n=1 Tax=Promethearchaeum syntrophicum TaxID=2594042 RepID=A0A5B9D6U7_9ARCH|nr:DNA methyltransferase [Candidatus Prometheoarchaeum syntrophicum]QEE14691.1 Eco57I restriction-modification methylase [Candidatus Prometheoarchaeum syntrophicum]
MTALWYLQRKLCFNKDSEYFLNHFNRKKSSLNHQFYSEFLTKFFNSIFPSNSKKLPVISRNSNQEELVIIGDYFLRDNHGFLWDGFIHKSLPNEAFFQDIDSTQLEKIKISKKIPESIINSLPLFNMFILQEIVGGPINDFIIGALFEKILSDDTKKSTGAYYTPDNICDFLAESSLNAKLFSDNLKVPFWINCENFFKSELDQYEFKLKLNKIQDFFVKINNFKILDPAVGSGHFLASITKILIKLYKYIWTASRNYQIKGVLLITVSDEIIDLNSFEKFKDSIAILKKFLFSSAIYGVDINPRAVIIAKIRLFLNYIDSWDFSSSRFLNPRLLRLNILTGNSLLGSINWSEKDTKEIKKNTKIKPFHWNVEFPDVFPINSNNFGFDIILGNPPYGNLLSNSEKKEIDPFYSFLNEISSVFIERAIDLNRNKGIIAFLTSYAICFSKDLSKTRQKIVNSYEISKIASFDRDKCRFFTKMTQSVSIIQCINKNSIKLNKNQFSDILTTNMFRKMPDLRNIKYVLANNFLLGKNIGVSFDKKHRLPKIGEKRAREFLELLSEHYTLNSNEKLLILGDILNRFLIIRNIDEYRNKLMQFEKEGKKVEDLISVRISGNYWYNAWEKPPYYGTQIALVEISRNIEGLKYFILILINSSLYYVWFRIYSDGRHMNSDIMKAFPLSQDLVDKLKTFFDLLKEFSSFLMKSLMQCFDKEHRRFNTSEMKNIIDICDIILGKIYDLPDDMVDYIQNFEPSVRGGKKISNEIEEKIRNLLNNSGNKKNSKKIIEDFKNIL